MATVECLGFVCMEVTDRVGSVGVGGDDFKGATFPDGGFTDFAVGRGALNSDCISDEVAWFVFDKVARVVCVVGCVEASVFGEVTEYFNGEVGLCVTETEEVM